MASPSPIRLETVGPTRPKSAFNRWIICHVASKLEHETKGTAQYTHGALALAIAEGFGAKLLAAGYDFPTMNAVECIEIVEGRNVRIEFAANTQSDGLETTGRA